MKPRIIVLITITFLCHLFLLRSVVMSQLLPSSQMQGNAAPAPSPTAPSGDNEQFTVFRGQSGAPAAKPEEPATIKARLQEKAGNVY
ncbi:MAG TPA: hypothetical protein VFZ99_04070, partial [Terriglobales bacterium]